MTDPATEHLVVLHAAANNNLWQEDDQRTTNEYDRRAFGLSEPLLDVTKQTDAAEKAGLIRLHVGVWGSRRWELTEAGRKVLAAHDAKETSRG